MRRISAALIMPLCLAAQPPLFHQAAFTPADARGGEWKVWSPRPEIAPRGVFEEVRPGSGSGARALSGPRNPAVFGGWERTVRGVEPEEWYRFEARYRAQGLEHASRQVVPRLDWVDAGGK